MLLLLVLIRSDLEILYNILDYQQIDYMLESGWPTCVLIFAHHSSMFNV